MSDQLLLIRLEEEWRLDPATRERGLRGVADARAMLRAGRRQVRTHNEESFSRNEEPFSRNEEPFSAAA